MTGTGLVTGVLTLNALFLVMGYALLLSWFRGRSTLSAASYAGVALLAGAGSAGVLLSMLAVTGLPIGPPALLAVAGVVVASGLVAARRHAAPLAGVTGSRLGSRSLVHVVADAALGFAATLLVVAITIAGFRSTPWLDDSWTMWLPRGRALEHLGLDARLFAPNPTYHFFPNPEYPLWWPIVGNLDVGFAGHDDLRALNAQSALLLAGLASATARLLWGHVRAWLLWAGILVVLLAPELIRNAQSGGADIPLAVYLGAFALTASLWLLTRETLPLVLAVIFAATAIAMKSEGAPQVVLLVAVLSALAWRGARAPLLRLWLAVVAAGITLLPFAVWRQANGAKSPRGFLGDLADPSALLDRTERIGNSFDRLASLLLGLGEWGLAVPALLAIALAGVLLERRLLWLGAWLFVGLGVSFWVLVYWADPLPPEQGFVQSVYRVVASLVVVSGVAFPLLSERLLQVIRVRRRGPLPPPGPEATGAKAHRAG